MAKIVIEIPDDKLDWVLKGFAIRYNYEELIRNPDYKDQEPEDPETNPRKIKNPESPQAFVKRMLIHMIKSEANTGHNQKSMEANAIMAKSIELK
jgi:hypothetical protein